MFHKSIPGGKVAHHKSNKDERGPHEKNATHQLNSQNHSGFGDPELNQATQPGITYSVRINVKMLNKLRQQLRQHMTFESETTPFCPCIHITGVSAFLLD